MKVQKIFITFFSFNNLVPIAQYIGNESALGQGKGLAPNRQQVIKVITWMNEDPDLWHHIWALIQFKDVFLPV